MNFAPSVMTGHFDEQFGQSVRLGQFAINFNGFVAKRKCARRLIGGCSNHGVLQYDNDLAQAGYGSTTSDERLRDQTR